MIVTYVCTPFATTSYLLVSIKVCNMWRVKSCTLRFEFGEVWFFNQLNLAYKLFTCVRNLFKQLAKKYIIWVENVVETLCILNWKLRIDQCHSRLELLYSHMDNGRSYPYYNQSKLVHTLETLNLWENELAGNLPVTSTVQRERERGGVMVLQPTMIERGDDQRSSWCG